MNLSVGQRAAVIFEASLEIPDEERNRWLEVECAGDPSLLQQVRELLSLHQDAAGLFDLDATVESSLSEKTSQSVIGSTLGDFEIDGLLGKGGMGEVYRARQLSLNRVVALKVLRLQHRDESALRRFKAEINAAANLHHSNIVRVYTSGSQGDIHYFAMELVDGPTLGDVIRRLKTQRLPELLHGSDVAETLAPVHPSQDTLGGTVEKKTQPEGSATPLPAMSEAGYFQWVAQQIASVADGLNYAHSQLLVHRDVKPANLLLAADGRVLISDFGLARNISEPGITQTGEILGTPFYMSPEQLSSSATLDHRTDIYSLGATLYELLTLQPPFPGESRDHVLARIVSDEPVRPGRINPKIPKDLETICLKALEKSVEDRFHSAGALADDLRRHLDGQPILARRTGIAERALKWAHRHRGLAASLIALPCCVAVVATLFAIQNYRLAMELQAETLRANEVIFDAKVEQARALRSSDSPNKRSQSLNSLGLALQTLSKLQVKEPELSRRILSVRNEAIAALAVPELKVAQVFPEEKPWTVEVAFAPDFRSYAQPARNGEVRVVPLDGGQTILLRGQSNPARQMKFSADGKFLATKHYQRGLQNEATVCVWSLEQGAKHEIDEPILELKDRWIFVSDFGFDPTSQSFASHKPEIGIELYRLDQPSEPVKIVPFAASEVILAFLSDNRLAYSKHRDNELRLIDLESDEALSQAVSIAGRITALGWQSHPGTFVVGTSEGDIHVWQGLPKNRPLTVRAHDREIITVCCQPGGRLVATATLNEQAALTDLATKKSLRISEMGERLHLCSGGFGADGHKLGFFHLGEFGFWSVSKSPVIALGADDEPKLFTQLRFHPQCERLIVRGCRDEVEFWDSREGALLTSIASGGAQEFRFAPDGRFLYLASSEGGLVSFAVDVRELEEQDRLQMTLGDEVKLLTESCTHLAMSPAGKVLAVSYASENGYSIKVLDPSNSSVLQQIDGLTRPKSLHFSSDGDSLWLCGYNPNRMVEVHWRTGKVVELPESLPSEIADVVVSNDAGLVALRGTEGLHLYSGNSWVEVREQNLEPVRSARVGLNGNGTMTATNYDESTTQLIDIHSGQTLALMSAYPRETIRFYEFSPSGSKLGIAGSRNMHIWDLTLLQEQLKQLELSW